jgi:hypothetical protein
MGDGNCTLYSLTDVSRVNVNIWTDTVPTHLLSITMRVTSHHNFDTGSHPDGTDSLCKPSLVRSTI